MNHLKKEKMPVVVIFGRTNVGKSTLFNCLIEKRQALVSTIEGTTRDSNINQVNWRGQKFNLVDTGGIIDIKNLIKKKLKSDDLNIKVQKQVCDYLKQADLILFLVDNKTGLLKQDLEMAMVIKKNRSLKNKTILVANKTDNINERPNTAEFNKLALGEPIPVSASNGSGSGDLLDIIMPKINLKKYKENEVEGPEEKIKVCIIGKPNVGKSSLLNAILGYERVMVSPIPHTTREPQNTEITYENNIITLIDTAGISKKGQKTKNLEKYGIEKSLKALKKSDLALLVIDINKDITHQDAKLVEEIVEKQVSFIFVANKWDLIEEKNTKNYTKHIYSSLPFATWAPIHFASALTKSKVDKLTSLIVNVSEQRRKKISDSQLSKFLNKIVKIHKPAKGKGTRHPRIYELKQVKSNPPKFEIRIGSKDNLHFSYTRFIENRLREKFGFSGTPLTTKIIKGKNNNNI